MGRVIAQIDPSEEYDYINITKDTILEGYSACDKLGNRIDGAIKSLTVDTITPTAAAQVIECAGKYMTDNITISGFPEGYINVSDLTVFLNGQAQLSSIGSAQYTRRVSYVFSDSNSLELNVTSSSVGASSGFTCMFPMLNSYGAVLNKWFPKKSDLKKIKIRYTVYMSSAQSTDRRGFVTVITPEKSGSYYKIYKNFGILEWKTTDITGDLVEHSTEIDMSDYSYDTFNLCFTTVPNTGSTRILDVIFCNK